ncbi:MAG: sulfotransferase family 2 domain-containing protein [Desulfovibrionaceae bacterium]|jgi:hypothetical protein|nr:sulfotransferase family 2 domain-containing protein [Desulfovibrionaceae bacterium]
MSQATTPQDRTVLFFLHIPRTAGTTLNHILADNFGPDGLLTAYDRQGLAAVESLTAETARNIRCIQGHILVQDFDRLLDAGLSVAPFTFLREPVARVVSEYRFLRAWPHHHLHALLAQRNVGLAEYVAGTDRELRFRGKNLMTRVLSGLDFPATGTPGDPARDARLADALATAKRNLSERFAFVGVTERFDESVLLLRRVFDLRFPFHVRRNALAGPQPGSGAAKPPDATALELVRAHNRADAELFAHAQALLTARAAEAGPDLERELRTLRFVNRRLQIFADRMARATGDTGPVLHPKAVGAA